ncbi:MAG: PAS domain-containing protein [Bacteroidales bacterium]|nr:PAS domain-containing protein [Bacteroidales bacterium]
MLAENITDVIWTVNVTKRTFTYISPSVTHLTGLTVEEAMNQRLEEILAPDSAKIIHDELSVLMPILMKGHDTKLSRTYEFQQRGKDGRFIWIEVVAQWHHSPTGDIEILGVSRNIDERKEAEKQLKDSQLRWKFALEGSKDGVWDWNIETNLVYFSPQWKAMLGYGEDELNDELDEWKKRVHPDDLDKCLSDIGDHLNGVTDAYTNIHRLLCKDNSYKWVLDRGMITERKDDGKPVRIIGTHTDLTERMEMENTLRKLNADKDQFIRILGHDLRSPFNALIGFSDLLIENLDQFDRQQIEKQLRIIHQTSVSTFNLLDQILLWSKSQSGNLVLNIEKFGFVNAVQEVLNTVEKVATQKKIQTVIVDPNDSIITADMNIFRTVLRNLIINAIKFTHTNGRIVISAKKESDRIVTTVMDNGVGIEPSQMATLWDVNSNSTTNGTGGESGTGFGLKLCKELVERHGGHIWVESVAGKGSEFFFTLHN